MLASDLEQRAHGAMAAIALVLRRHLPVPTASTDSDGNTVASSARTRVLEVVEPLRLQPLEVLVERVDEHPEREILLQLRRRPRQDEMSESVGLDGELGEQARLADAGLTHQLDGHRVALAELGDEPVERPKLGGRPTNCSATAMSCQAEHR